tara:strand:+ start:67231 stop:67353 length:123 start_codon:yes stop_codon:yes gene_type:complete
MVFIQKSFNIDATRVHGKYLLFCGIEVKYIISTIKIRNNL